MPHRRSAFTPLSACSALCCACWGIDARCSVTIWEQWDDWVGVKVGVKVGAKLEQVGEYEIGAGRELVWEALNDPEVLAACIPGCQSIERASDTHFDAQVKAKIGPVSAMFSAALDLEDLNPPQSYSIVGAVKGGAAGFGKGQAEVQLEALAEDRTRLTYTVKGSVGGKLAQIGSRLVDGATRKMADDFFAAFAGQLAPSDQAAATSSGEPSTEPPTEPSTDKSPAASAQPDAPAPRSYESQGRGFVWGVAFLILVMAIVLAL